MTTPNRKNYKGSAGGFNTNRKVYRCSWCKMAFFNTAKLQAHAVKLHVKKTHQGGKKDDNN